MRFLYSISILFFLVVSCKKKAEENPKPIDTETGQPTKTGSFSMEFQTLVGTENLEYEKKYQNEKGEPYTVNIFQYYVSNIQLKKPDGSVTKIPDTYYLIKANIQDEITIDNVPEGTYSGISFDLGVDSLHNVSGAQAGALDPANGMFWDWNSGYIFFMLEGTSDSSKQASKIFQYHISGFKKSNYVINTVSKDIPVGTLDVKANSKPNVHYFVQLNEVFKTPNLISIAAVSAIHMPGANAMKIAENYKDMFTLDHVEK